jgi:mannose-1-phosphate guanylyltransferase
MVSSMRDVEFAMVLGAGRGTRLGSLGLAVPKALVEVSGTPLLRRQFEYLGRHGVKHVVVNAHHLSEMVEDFARQYKGPVAVTVVHEPVLLGTAGAVRNVLERLGDGPFFVLYGDVLVDEPLGLVAETHDRSGAEATITVYETHEIEGKGTVLTDLDGWVTGFAEKQPPPPGSSTALVNAGLYLLDPSFVADLPCGVERDFGHDVFPDALARGSRMRAHRLAREVIDVGTPAGLELAEQRIAAEQV